MKYSFQAHTSGNYYFWEINQPLLVDYYILLRSMYAFLDCTQAYGYITSQGLAFKSEHDYIMSISDFTLQMSRAH